MNVWTRMKIRAKGYYQWYKLFLSFTSYFTQRRSGDADGIFIEAKLSSACRLDQFLFYHYSKTDLLILFCFEFLKLSKSYHKIFTFHGFLYPGTVFLVGYYHFMKITMTWIKIAINSNVTALLMLKLHLITFIICLHHYIIRLY